MIRKRVLKLLSEWFDERMSAYEEKRKHGKKRRMIQPPLCQSQRHCHIVFEYRPDYTVYLRCKKCMRVYKKRPMDGNETANYHDLVVQSIIDTQGAQKVRSENMENDGSRFLDKKVRAAHVNFCEKLANTVYREDNLVQFHLLDDFTLCEYVEAYKYDQATESILDKFVPK